MPHLLEEAGCFAIVLEKIPAALAARVAQEVSIPVIGIGAGGGCRRTSPGHPRYARYQSEFSPASYGAIITYMQRSAVLSAIISPM